MKDLLEFSRESFREKEVIAIETILDEVVTFFHKQPNFSNIIITENYVSGLPQISVDPNQIIQVFMNLVINAGHAMPQGGNLDISTYRSEDGKYICAAIKDSGQLDLRRKSCQDL